MPNIPKSYKYRYNGVIHTGPSVPAGAELLETTDTLDTQTYNILSLIYPIGSIYIGTQSTCPLATLISGSTWVLVAQDKALWGGDGTNANTTITAGLPNITGEANFGDIVGVSYPTGVDASGAFSSRWVGTVANVGSNYVNNETSGLSFDASRSSAIYGNSTTVQPPAYVVNVWRRTA